MLAGLVLGLMVLAASAKADSGRSVNSESKKAGKEPLPAAKLDAAFDLPVGKEIAVDADRLVIAFTDVPVDSRCPKGAKCVWAGNAKVALKLTVPGQPAIAAIVNTGVDPKEFAFAGYRIRLVELDPYPRVGAKPAKASYTIRLLVAKNPK
jgi:hypothetical protein